MAKRDPYRMQYQASVCDCYRKVDGHWRVCRGHSVSTQRDHEARTIRRARHAGKRETHAAVIDSQDSALDRWLEAHDDLDDDYEHPWEIWPTCEYAEPACVPERIVFHRMGIVVAEVTVVINRKADERIRRGTRVLAALDDVARAFKEFMESAPADPFAMSGARAANEYRALRELNEEAKTFEEKVVYISRQFGPINKDTRQAIAEFLEWLPEYTAKLRERAVTFERRVGSDLRRNSERLDELAAAWSVVDGDGLT